MIPHQAGSNMSRILKNSMLTCFFIAAVPSASFCQTGDILTVMVLDAKNGKPLKHVRIWLGWLKGPVLPNVETNHAGIAAFHLPNPLPAAHPWLSSPFIDICSNLDVSIDQVLVKGIAGENNCGAAKFSGNPNPGELVIFGRRLNVFQRIWNLLY
jgi:hypothetical protein